MIFIGIISEYNSFENIKDILKNNYIKDIKLIHINKNSIENIKKVLPKKLVYISCNPATLVRDLAKLENIYEIKKIKPVDMFPYTNGIECVSILELKNK